MEARLLSATCAVAAFACMGASHRTQNFVVTAPTPSFARQVGQEAERFRIEAAREWIGRELPPWPSPCPIRVDFANGAGGATSFMFDGNGQPYGWRMNVQGSPERILDSVLPHEVTHTIFATHFGRPLPRWADEGACTTMEHLSERQKQHDLLIRFLTALPSRGIAFDKMFRMTEYPHDILPLYAQGYSLARFLITQGGKRTFLRYVGDGMNTNDWNAATREHYGIKNLRELQDQWLVWLRSGCPHEPNASSLATRGQGAEAPVSSPEAPIRLASNSVSPSTGKSSGSWYVRQKGSATKNTPAADTKRLYGTQRVTRPQSVEGPNELVLEWDDADGQRPNRSRARAVRQSRRAILSVDAPTSHTWLR